MLPLSTIQQSFQQAQQASVKLRKLVVGNARPTAQAVRSCMEAGAQFNWMTQQGKQSNNDTAISMALARGYHEALDVLLEYTGKVAPPRGGSFFVAAMGTHKQSVAVEDFRHAVDALLRHGYGFEDDECSATALGAAMGKDLPEHAAVLLDAGALVACNDPMVAKAVLGDAMGMEGGVKMLTERATPWQKEVFGGHWWECLRSAPVGDDVPYILSVGLSLSQPTSQDQDYLANNRPELLAGLIAAGLDIQSFAPVDEWESTTPEPFWRRNPHAMFKLLDGQCDPSSFVLDQSSPRDGTNWLSFMVLHQNLVWKKNYTSVDALVKTRRAVPQAIAAGLDIHAVDHRGYTAGWYILLDLIESADKHPAAHVKAWLDLVRDFDLYAAPVVIGGEVVPFLEAHEGQMARFLGRHGLLEQAQAATLQRTVVPSVGRPTSRRI